MVDPTGKLKAEEISDGFETWLTKPYLSDQTRKLVSKANVLLVPWEGFRDEPRAVFPQGTDDFFNFLKHQPSGNLDVEICIDDDDYLELDLHADPVTLPTILVSWVVLPVLTGLVANYLDRVLQRRKRNTTFRLTIISVEGPVKATRFSFEGTREDFEAIVDVLRSRG